jgi:hypothetical protein
MDEALHLQAQQGHRHRRGRQAALADHVVDADLLVVQAVIDLLLVLAELQGGQDAGLAGGGRTVAGREQVFELAQDVLGAFAQLGAFLNEIVAAFAAGRVDAPGHGEDLPAILIGEVGGDERAAGEVGLDHHGAQRHAGHQAVADGERLPVGRAVEGELGDDRAVGGDLLEELRILGRRDEVDCMHSFTENAISVSSRYFSVAYVWFRHYSAPRRPLDTTSVGQGRACVGVVWLAKCHWCWRAGPPMGLLSRLRNGPHVGRRR